MGLVGIMQTLKEKKAKKIILFLATKPKSLIING
jgi:hypothetical protein